MESGPVDEKVVLASPHGGHEDEDEENGTRQRPSLPTPKTWTRRCNDVAPAFQEIAMTSRKKMFATAAVTLAMAGSAWADTSAELDALKARIAQLEAQQAKENQKAVDKVIADATRRSSFMMADGMTAGYDNGFFLASSDGSFKLQPWAQFQFRYVNNFSNVDGAFNVFDEDTNVDDGFEVRRLKFGFKGHAISEDLTYAFTWATNRSGGGLTLETAVVQYMFADNMGLKVGQWKDNVFHEETVSSGRQLAVDRSLINEQLGGGQTDYVQGAALILKQDNLRGEVAFHDGANTDNTNFRNGSGNFGVSARAEYLVNGDWKAYDDFSAMGDKEGLLVIGAGFDWTQSGDADTVYHTVDAQFETDNGLAVYGAYVGQFIMPGDSNIGNDDDTYDFGILAQVAYMLPDSKIEPFARYGIMFVDDNGPNNVAGGEDYFQEITVGANYYLHKHNAKVTVDLVFLPDGSPGDHNGVGILGGVDEQIVVRGQFQLMI
jgi:Phosphate-selective porin O and P